MYTARDKKLHIGNDYCRTFDRHEPCLVVVKPVSRPRQENYHAIIRLSKSSSKPTHQILMPIERSSSIFIANVMHVCTQKLSILSLFCCLGVRVEVPPYIASTSAKHLSNSFQLYITFLHPNPINISYFSFCSFSG